MSDFHMFKGGLFGARKNPAWIAQALEEQATEKKSQEDGQKKKGGGGGMSILMTIAGGSLVWSMLTRNGIPMQ